MQYIDDGLSITHTEPPILTPGKALIQIKYFALSPEDVQLYKSGMSITKLGAAFSGTVVSLADDISKKLDPGDSVMGFLSSGGAAAQFIACDVRLLIKVPPRLPLEDAAMIPNLWVTAFQLIKHDASFLKRERLAIFGANSPNGLATAQLSQLLGCRRVHCVASPDFPEIAEEKFRLHGALPDEVIFHKCPDDVKDIAKYDPKGLEVIIDLSGSPRAWFEITRPHGRIVWSLASEFKHEQSEQSRLLPLNLDLMVLKNIRVKGASIRSQNPVNFQEHLDFIEEHIIPKYISRQLQKPVYRLLDWSLVKDVLNEKWSPTIHILRVN